MVPVALEADPHALMLPQAHYTSCRSGLGSGAGFQFSAASPALARRLYELERLVLYRPPPSAPSEPTDAEIRALPVRFQYRELDGDARVLSRGRYLGRDYSNRYGNFFTHLVAIDDPAALGDQLPVDLWDAPFWLDAPDGGPELPQLVLPAGGADGLDAALRVLNEPPRARLVPEFVDGIAAAVRGEGRVVVVDDAGAARAWIELASRCLPAALARRLTFCSFEVDPRGNDAMCCVATRDAQLGFAPFELRTGVTLIDPSRPPAAATPSLHARLIGALVAAGAAATVRTFARSSAGDDLGAALALHAGPRYALDALEAAATLRHAAAHPADDEPAWLLERLLDDAATAELMRDCAASDSPAGDLAIAWLLAHPRRARPALSAAPPTGVHVPAGLEITWEAELEGADDATFVDALRTGQLLGVGRRVERAVGRRLARIAGEGGADAANDLPPAALEAFVDELAADGRARPAEVLRAPAVRAALRRREAAATSFDALAPIVALLMEAGELDGRSALSVLLERAPDRVLDAVALVHGAEPPATVEAAEQLFDALTPARALPGELVRWLAEPLAADTSNAALAFAERLDELPEAPAFVRAFANIGRRPQADAKVERWIAELARLAEQDAAVQAPLGGLVAERVAAIRDPDALVALLEALPDWVAQPLPAALERALADDRGPIAAAYFAAVVAHRKDSTELVVTFEAAVSGWTEKRRRGLADLIPSRTRDAWAKWDRRHPARASWFQRLRGRSNDRR